MKSIRVKILSAVIAILLITTGFLSYFSLQEAKKSLENTVKQTLDIVSSKAEKEIADLNNRHFTMIRALAHIPYYADPNITLEEKCAQLNALTTLDPSTYVNVAFYDADGYTIYGGGARVNFSDMDYVKRSLAGQEVTTDPIFFSAADLEGRSKDGSVADMETDVQILIFYAVPVYGKFRKVVGSIVAIINGACFRDIVKNIDMGDGIHPAIIARTTATIFGIAKNQKQTYVNIPELFENEEFKPIRDDMLAGNQKRLNINYPGINKKTIISYNPVPGTTWTLMSAVPYSYYFGHLTDLVRVDILILVVSTLAACFVIIPLIHAIVRPLNVVSKSINQIASGNADLTQRIAVKSKDEVGLVVQGFNNFTNKLQDILKNIKSSQTNLENVGRAMDSSTQDTSASITEIIANIESVHKQIINQSESVQQTATAVNEIAANISSLERLIINQSNGVTSASSAVEEMMGNIQAVNNSVDKMASSFDRLLLDTQTGSSKQADVTKKVEQIVTQSKMLQEANQVISNIASQTNLLAMNAAIEAAHAGEAGKGFSVVADEIRKLSETSTTQSKTIKEQLNSIRKSIEEVVIASHDSNSAFISVSDAIKDTDEIVRLIKIAMEEQTLGSQQINQALHEMNDSTAEVKTAGHEMAEGNQHILSEVKNLQDSTYLMKQSMEEMSIGAERINMTGTGLNEISSKLKESIEQIGNEVNLFKV
ncbi:methyl-accepting chemotaxis protein [Treponema sp.]|uniref:methyl-accepting chemotaxis protein n=1 Tax=Treponema sp. TaxID=166 RepID=UPI00298E5787|nr:methyl-accepting chemotaxis protein [Treponema sp.]